jgi:phenylalanyl-tRNA synthetase beta chain
MKVSYNTLKKYIPNIKPAEEVAQDLIMHTAEVEDIIYQWESFNNIVIWEITEISNHPDADKLKVCSVNIWNEENQIVCGGSNLEVWQKVAVAKIGAKVSWHWEEIITMKKTKIRWIESSWMICASEEIWLKEEFPAESETEILDLSSLNIKAWDKLSEILDKNDYYLDIDNKAINHRPDLFSHVWIMREICAINWEKFDFEFENKDFSNSEKILNLENSIPKLVKRYIWIKISGVKNIETPKFIKEVISSHGIDSKGLLVDITNYSLYFYGQPTHIFDADKISWKITIREALKDEKFLALDDKEYFLNAWDIVIADEEKVLALGWIIWGKESSVSNTTKNIVIESANFDQAIIRKTWKILWLRTDALNVFEKDLLPEMAHKGASLIVSELEKIFTELKIEEFIDSYDVKQKEVEIVYDLDFINNLIWKEYSSNVAEKIIRSLWIVKKWDKLQIPFWRKELNYKADIAEEIARIDWFDNIETTPPSINMWAVSQSNTYRIKDDTRNFFTSKWYFDMYNYSFVNEELMNNLESSCKNLIPLKNSLSAELTHMKWSLIPNLMNSLKDNIRDSKDLKLFEIEKVFKLDWTNISENYEVASVITSDEKIPYYEIQKVVTDYLKTIWIDNFSFDKAENIPKYSHSWRTAKIIARWKDIWFVWEIHPEISKRFDIHSRVAFFYINVDTIKQMAYSIIKVSEISQFQMNNFDINFVVDKEVSWKNITSTILNTDKKLIKKVELFDIFESEEKLPWKRSLSFKVFIQSEEWTLDDKIKNNLIEEIKKKVEKKGWELR